MLQEAKDYLKITWNDEDTHIQGIINRGKDELNNLVGVDLDFETNNLAKSLLFDYCRYAYNNALEYFEENFQRKITRLQLTEAVKEYANQS